MKVVTLSVILALAVSLSAAASVKLGNQDWELFKRTHGKNYTVVEDIIRLEIFLKNVEKIAEHNLRYEKGEVSYFLGSQRICRSTQRLQKRWTSQKSCQNLHETRELPSTSKSRLAH